MWTNQLEDLTLQRSFEFTCEEGACTFPSIGGVYGGEAWHMDALSQ